MPFVARTVEPRLLCRQPRGSAVPDERAPGSPALFATLDEVWGRALGGLLQQLSDLSRHAADLFSDLEAESRSVWLRSAGLQRRLETLQGSVRSLDPKKVKIRLMQTMARMNGQTLKGLLSAAEGQSSKIRGQHLL